MQVKHLVIGGALVVLSWVGGAFLDTAAVVGGVALGTSVAASSQRRIGA